MQVLIWACVADLAVVRFLSLHIAVASFLRLLGSYISVLLFRSLFAGSVTAFDRHRTFNKTVRLAALPEGT